MLRSRDIVALVLALILSRMAWNDGTESLSASANLAFYFKRDKATVLSPMDVDGDGTNEALAIVKASASGGSSWVLQILDLKPLHNFKKTHLAPFEPEVLFTSAEMNEDNAIPIRLTSGQVLIKKKHGSDKQKKKKPAISPSDQDINDRNRHYFCGTDWHDASTKCGTPCPGGQASECETDERCFADTPCDSLNQSTHEDTQVLFQLTPGGGLPSLVTLWSNGAMTMHSLTNDMLSVDNVKENSKKEKKSRSNKPKLKLEKMWHVKILPDTIHGDHILWEESNILFLDAYSSEETVAENGIIVASGSFYNEGEEDNRRASFILAVDAMKGTVLWDSFSDEDRGGDEELPLPIVRGTTSYARRRSRIAALYDQGPTTTDLENLPNCMFMLKHRMKDVMPYSYWGPKDAKLEAIHVDMKRKRKEKNNHHDVSKPNTPKQTAGGNTKKKWHHRFHKPKQQSLSFGRPNVLVTHSQGGLQIRSLRNGKAMCHLSLLEETLYSDLNNDGILDQVQILLESTKVDPQDKWVWNLVSKVQQDRQELKEKGAQRQLLNSNPNLCHAMALSGLPAKEELFSTPLCGSSLEGNNPLVSLASVAPVVVESLSGRRNTRDVIVALNNGMMHRLQGGSGRKQWTESGAHHENFPTWEQGSQNALLTRLQSSNVAASIRPVLLAGENGLAVLSIKNGGILASAPFPQTSISRPILAEVSGDGTTDVVILSQDGIWGFQIQLRPGNPVVLRILVGLLLMVLMLALLRNRFGQRTDKRATDV